MSLDAGSRLGHYEILGLLGAGGMGEVYRALDLSLERQVAIKVLPAELIADEERLRRFEREAKVLAALDHPHIVTIFSVESQDDVRFFVMELVEGRTLSEVLRGGGLESASFFEHGLAIVDAVAAAHQRGVTHRDLKPANVMLCDADRPSVGRASSGRASAGRASAGRVKVLDFGLAKDRSPGSPSASSETLSAGLTQAGAVLGTVPYMSPEQLQGKPVESTSDVFSLGVMLYEMATGERPFRGESQIEVASAILRDTPRAPSEVVAELPRELDAILGCCLEKEPGERYPSASELYEALAKLRENLVSGISHAGRIPTSVMAAKVYRTPMVGREAEEAQLRDALGRAAAGSGSLVTLAGEPGVGKTRLATEVVTDARAQGFLSLIGNCHEGEGAPPLSPWVEILETTARIADKETLRELLGDGAPQIATLQPSLRHLYPDLPPPLELPPEAERSYLFNCFRDFVERSSRVQPVLLVLEDLQWADDASLLLLQHIAERIGEMAVLVVGTYRDVELDVALPLANALRELVRRRRIERIALGRLFESGVAEILEALGGAPPPSSLVAAIFAETEGNPFFVEEVYEHLAEEGRLFDEQGRWREDLTIEELDVPEGIRLVVGRRLERLDDGSRRILTTAAVLGRRFSYAVLEAAVEAVSDLLLDGIEAAERLHLVEAVRSSSPREARYQFSHELIRQTLLQNLSMPRRQRLHLRAAEAMEEVYGDGIDEQASAMAHHLYQAGAVADEGKTLRFLTLAADQAFEIGGFEQALEHLERALSMLPAGQAVDRVDLLWRRGRARRSLGSFEEASDDWSEALSLCGETTDRQTVAEISSELALLLLWTDRPAEGVEAARRGLSLVGGEESAERCLLLGWVGTALTYSGDLEAGDVALSEAVAAAEELGDVNLQGDLAVVSSDRSFYTMQIPDMLLNIEAAMPALQSRGDVWHLVEAQCWRRQASVYMGHPDTRPSAEEEAAERLGHHGSSYAAVEARAHSVWIATADLGRYEECLEQLSEISGRAEMPYFVTLYGFRAMACFWRGDWERARQLALDGVEREPAEFFWRGLLASALFLIESHLGRREEALAILEVPDLLPRHAGVNRSGAWMALIRAVEGLVLLGERKRAAQLYSLLLGALDTRTIIAMDADRLVQTTAGIGAAAARQWERAEEHYQIALRQADKIPFISEQADARRWYAHMLLDRDGPGDVARARQYLEEAIAIYQRIGMPRHVEMAETLLGRA